MANFNKIILIGNLTRDPELKYLPNNTAVCEFGMAINHRWRDKEGNQKEDVCFVDIAAFGKQGETINQYMAKGRQLLVEGRLKLDQWTAQDGTKRSRHSVVLEGFQFLGDRAGGERGAGAPAGRENAGGGGYERPPARESGGQERGGREAGGYGRAPAREPQPGYDGPGHDAGDGPSGGDIPF